ncbi:serine hydrolase domain-containing protein [Agromyces binzhouensis]|uniref:serine hydrolase domain-containing protein n=1 Tax=Agromyces binzhouensis TaxID=1817495 RepID=UPI003638F39D
MIAVAAATALWCSNCTAGQEPSDTSPEATDAGSSSTGGATGDPELVESLGQTFGDDVDRAAAVLVARDTVRSAFVNADETTMFEFGSISKALLGLLLAEAVERGEVAPDDPVGAYLDLGSSDATAVTLEQLATHHAGLPLLPSESDDADPFPDAPGMLSGLVAGIDLPAEPEPEYSNVGAALLGAALSAGSGMPYAELLRDRVLDPAGMDDAVVVSSRADVPSTLEPGYTLAGIAVEPWTFGDYAPAGGVAGTAVDLTALARAVLDGPFSESAALDPHLQLNTRASVGYLWFIDEQPGRTLTLHDGTTGGYSASLLVDRDSGVAAAVLWNAPGDAQEVARRLLLLAD